MNDHFLKAWAEQKVEGWIGEAERDRQAGLATSRGAPGSRLRQLSGRLFHRFRVRHHQARSDDVRGLPTSGIIAGNGSAQRADRGID